MSSTEVKFLSINNNVIKEVGKVEIKNSHGTAPIIWNNLAQKFFGISRRDFIPNPEKVWPLFKDKKISQQIRATLGMTYNGCVIVKSDFEKAANDINLFLKEFPADGFYQNNWKKIQEIFESNPDCDAIGFHLNTMSENPFSAEASKKENKNKELENFWHLYPEMAKYE